MTVNEDTITYISKLAKLDIKESEIGAVTAQIEKILGYMQSLKAVGQDAAAEEQVATLAMRRDEVLPSADKDMLLENCAERTYFAPVVPKVVE